MPSQNSVLLAAAIVGAALYAGLRRDPAPLVDVERPHSASFDQQSDDMNDMDPGQEDDELPPGHPPIGGMGSNMGSTGDMGQQDDGPPSISWKAPATWKVGTSSSTMRLATYVVPSKSGVGGEAELSVVRAGGSTEANLTRWLGQFTDRTASKRSERTVRGMHVSMLEVSGTFSGGGMSPNEPPVARRGWMLEGAVVETDQGSYFFKLTGPVATVTAAHADFDALLNSIEKAKTAASL